jgi:molybdenum cofactor cytidylyltransferase
MKPAPNQSMPARRTMAEAEAAAIVPSRRFPLSVLRRPCCAARRAAQSQHPFLQVHSMTYASLATGVLLAAGRGSRFDPSGVQNKLLAPLADGTPLARASAHRLLISVPRVIAVVRPGAEALAHVLNEAGCDVVFSSDAQRGMGASLAAGVRASGDAEGWLVALADMPWIATATVEAVTRTLGAGASLVVPFYRGQRGHPVGFANEHYDALAALDGDTGARALLAAHQVTRIDVDDWGVVGDVDTADDLKRSFSR